MTLTILSAAYANPSASAAVVQTVERGAVLLSDIDTPDEWRAMLFAVAPASFVPPSPPASPTKAELMAQLAALQAQIAALPD